MAARKRIVRREWSKADLRELKTMARARTPAKSIGRRLKRTEGAVRQKAFSFGTSLATRQAPRVVAEHRHRRRSGWRAPCRPPSRRKPKRDGDSHNRPSRFRCLADVNFGIEIRGEPRAW